AGLSPARGLPGPPPPSRPGRPDWCPPAPEPRYRRVPKKISHPAALARREDVLEHPPLDPYAEGRPFRGARTARGAGARGDRVLRRPVEGIDRDKQRHVTQDRWPTQLCPHSGQPDIEPTSPNDRV